MVILNEVERFTYIMNDVKEVHCLFNKSAEVFENRFSEGMVKDIYQFERPDILIPTGSKNILLEYFQFDSSSRNKRSSTQKEEEAHFDRLVKGKLNNPPEKGVLVTRHEFKTASSIEYFEQNLSDITSAHINKYEDYITNYRENSNALHSKNLFSDEVEFGLIIESTSILPDIMIGLAGNQYLLTPFHFKSFRDILRNHKFVKHIFYICGNGSSSFVVYYLHNDDYSDETFDEVFSISDGDKLIDITPIGLSGVMRIPRKLTKK